MIPSDRDLERELERAGQEWRTSVQPIEVIDASLIRRRGAQRPWSPIVAGALGATSLAAVVALGGLNSRPPLAGASPDRSVALATALPPARAIVVPGDAVEATGALLATGDGQMALCSGIPVEANGAPGCSGADLVPLLAVAPDAVASQYGRVVGTWDGAAINVSAFTPLAQPGYGLGTSPECAAPDTGWLPVSTNGDAAAAGVRLREEVRRDASSYAGMWSSVTHSTDGRIRAVILNVAVVGDSAAARASLSDIYPYNLCVVEVAHSAAELEPVVAALEAMDEPWHVEIDPSLGRIAVAMTVVTQEQDELLRPYADLVDIRPTVAKVPGEST